MKNRQSTRKPLLYTYPEEDVPDPKISDTTYWEIL